MEEGLRFGVFGPLRLFHDLAEAIQKCRGSVLVAELVLDHREDATSSGRDWVNCLVFNSSERVSDFRLSSHCPARYCLRSTQRQAAFN